MQLLHEHLVAIVYKKQTKDHHVKIWWYIYINPIKEIFIWKCIQSIHGNLSFPVRINMKFISRKNINQNYSRLQIIFCFALNIKDSVYQVLQKVLHDIHHIQNMPQQIILPIWQILKILTNYVLQHRQLPKSFNCSTKSLPLTLEGGLSHTFLLFVNSVVLLRYGWSRGRNIMWKSNQHVRLCFNWKKKICWLGNKDMISSHEFSIQITYYMLKNHLLST